MVNNSTQKNKLTLYDSSIFFDFLVLLMLIFSLIYGASTKNLDANSIFVKVCSYLCAPLSVVCATFLLSFKKKVNVVKFLLPKKSELITVVSMLLITFGMMFGLSELNNIFVSFLNNLGFTLGEITLPEKSLLNVTLVIIFVCILPAFFEEIAFRGIILGGLKNGGKIFAILVSGVVFSLFHMSPLQTVYQFIVGVLYAIIVLNGGDYSLTFISHLINNLFIVLNYYFIGFYPVGNLKIILTVFGLISLAIGLYLIMKNNKPYSQLESKKNYISGVPIGIIVCVIMWVMGLM